MQMFQPRGVLLLTGAAFVALAVAAAVLGTFAIDVSLRDAVLALASPPVVEGMRVVKYLGNWRVLAPATLLLLVAFEQARRRWWVWIGLMLTAPAAEGVLKAIVGRPRPEDLSFGFPSGHATAAAAFFGALAYLASSLPPLARRLVRALATVGVVLVGVSRVALRDHWPSDVLGGIALGLALAATAALIAAHRPAGSRGP